MKKFAFICCIILLALPSTAQKPAPKADSPYTLSVDVDLVLLNVSVFDRKGRVVSGLTEGNFKVFEDGKPQQIREFHPEDIPATVGLVIDNSGSMMTKRHDVIQAATQFVSESNPQDELFIVNFSDYVRMGLPQGISFSNDQTQLHDALLMIRADGRTALYDGVAQALQHLKNGTQQKKALVVLSDGGDNASHRALQDVLRIAEQSSATIYTIGIYDAYDRDRNPKVLKQLAKLTGGKAYILSHPKQLENIWSRIAGGIRSQYTIGYISTNPLHDGTFRNVKVSVVDKNGKPLEVRTREGYLAPKAGG